MGRTDKNHRRAMRTDDTDDDTVSTVSTATSSDFGHHEVEERDENTVLDGFVDALYEKRAKVREAALKGLINALKTSVLIDFVDDKHETLLHLCIGSLKKGVSSEAAFASQLIGLMAVTTGAGDVAQHILSEASAYLIKAAKFGSDSKARIAALEALALTCFVGSTNYEATEEIMDVLWQMSKRKGSSHPDQALGMTRAMPEVRAAALSAWTFLMTEIPTTRIVSQHMAQCSSALLSILENDEQNVRIAAGEAIAVVFEARSTIRSQYYADPSSTDASSALCRKNFENRETELVDLIKGLALEAGGKGQGNKKSQRSSFKEIHSVLKGEDVETSLKLQQGDSLILNSWIQVIQMKFLTGILAEGLQKHLQENTLLHEIFSFVPQQGKRKTLTSTEKRMYMSPNSVLNKARTQNMNRRRSQVHAWQIGQFGAEDVGSD
ncbi:hypothetical protein KP509_29G016900 [Ceratopteris richardii]|uniref:Interferon-related developmental regulator N-terminal domain-containing protein n=1 Tax=Ceratopteris richardii TaxID=49495 RepID=A0A8T2R776_CERRI|nr:hypothetical protein KP509_29G016900 [Ceratopteris richardii]KAH7291440.1 hypothetical protein KP509_29G016900 [Ceratopteris richardii]